MSKWKRTCEEVPEDGDFVFAMPQGTLLIWDDSYKCWDDSNDCYCFSKNDVECWVKIPEYDL